jgi:hypothetical protein
VPPHLATSTKLGSDPCYEKSPFSRLETCDLLIPGRRGSCSENFPELIADPT